MLLTIDPGKFHVGAALFDLRERRLLWGGHVKASSKNPAVAVQQVAQLVHESVGHGVSMVVCEQMNVRRQRAQKGDPNDLLFCMLMNGAVFLQFGGGRLTDSELVEVATWKGSVTKEVMRGRIIGDWGQKSPPRPPAPKLTVEEISILGPNPNHNVVDAVGIGLWKLERL